MFEPTETPLGEAVLTSFTVRGRTYVVDVQGDLFYIDTQGDDPNMWCWMAVVSL